MLSSSSNSRQEGLLARESTILSLNRPVYQHKHHEQSVCCIKLQLCAWLVCLQHSVDIDVAAFMERLWGNYLEMFCLHREVILLAQRGDSGPKP